MLATAKQLMLYLNRMNTELNNMHTIQNFNLSDTMR